MRDETRTHGNDRKDTRRLRDVSVIPILNPYFDLYEDLIGAQSLRLDRIRKRLVSAYSFAVPSRAVLEAIAAHGPVVEMGLTSFGAWRQHRREAAR